MNRAAAAVLAISVLSACCRAGAAVEYQVTESEDQIRITTPDLEVAVRKKGYVSGVAAQSFLDKKTGMRDAGFGLDLVDWIMELGERPVRAGESFSAAFVVGYFDAIDEMNRVYDQYKGHTRLEASSEGWKLLK